MYVIFVIEKLFVLDKDEEKLLRKIINMQRNGSFICIDYRSTVYIMYTMLVTCQK